MGYRCYFHVSDKVSPEAVDRFLYLTYSKAYTLGLSDEEERFIKLFESEPETVYECGSKRSVGDFSKFQGGEITAGLIDKAREVESSTTNHGVADFLSNHIGKFLWLTVD